MSTQHQLVETEYRTLAAVDNKKATLFQFYRISIIKSKIPYFSSQTNRSLAMLHFLAVTYDRTLLITKIHRTF